MLATLLDDRTSRAQLACMSGISEFEDDRLRDSVAEHTRGDKIFGTLPSDVACRNGRAANMVRLAIGQRELGKLQQSRETLVRAMSFRNASDWDLAARVRLNFGASYLGVDLSEVRRHWIAGLRVAEAKGLVALHVHALIDVGYLDLLDDRLSDAEERLSTAERLADLHGLENSLLRAHMNLAVLGMIQGDLSMAFVRLMEAESIGLIHRIGRRLWRVRANIATLHELLDDLSASYTWDRAFLHGILNLDQTKSSLRQHRPGIELAVANIMLRGKRSSAHRTLLNGVPKAIARVANEAAEGLLNDRLDSIPALRGRRCKRVSGQLRFVIVE
jgi:hypothetical protein